MRDRSLTEIERRSFLQLGTWALFDGLARARMATAATPGETQPDHRPATGRAKSCILIYLLGGPPHLDMFDMKPEAPTEIRGPFRPIESSVPGIEFCEHLPKLARRAHRLSILRSLSYPNNDHPYMVYYTLTGRVSPVPLGANTVLPPARHDFPHMGAVVSKFKHGDDRAPGYVAMPEVTNRMSTVLAAGGGRSGFLGPPFEPLAINDDPRKPMPLLNLPDGVSLKRVTAREKLLAVLDGRAVRSLRTRDYEATRRLAIQLSRSAADGGLLDLADEPAALKDRYGTHRFGQSLLLARRLVGHGVSFVAVHFNHMTKCDGWDTHKKNFEACKTELLPLVDQGLSALLDDLANRGLLDETLVVMMGEFGRTPKINGNAGRDHWGRCSSVVFAGGSVRGGNIVGASDRTGSLPVTEPFGPPDVVASIYHALGLDPQQTMYDHVNRPMPLSTGKVIAKLF